FDDFKRGGDTGVVGRHGLPGKGRCGREPVGGGKMTGVHGGKLRLDRPRRVGEVGGLWRGSNHNTRLYSMLRRPLRLAAALSAFGVAHAARAQSPTAVRVTVADTLGLAVSDMTVRLVRDSTVVRTGRTAADGT